MKILQLSFAGPPKRLAPSGAHLGMYQNLCALAALGHEVHLAIIGSDERAGPDVHSVATSVHDIPAARPPLLLRPLHRVLNPETFTLRFPAALGYAKAVRELADRVRPDVIWADSQYALAIAPRATYPVVFGNYDFLFKLKAVRKDTSSRFRLSDLTSLRKLKRPDALSIAALEALELRLCREAAAIMCVSASESDFLRTQGIASTHIPIVGPTIPPPDLAIPAGPPRFFLFGNHNTAFRSALAEIRFTLWPALERAGIQLEWHQIGRPPREADDDWQWMERSFRHVHGFVDELSSLFRVGDISVVPYRHDTGFRTKFTVAAAYGVASAGYTESFLCAPEFTPSTDCIAERDADALAAAFGRVQTDAAWRAVLGRGARTLYEKAFTFETQLPSYAHVLDVAVGGASAVRAVPGNGLA